MASGSPPAMSSRSAPGLGWRAARVGGLVGAAGEDLGGGDGGHRPGHAVHGVGAGEFLVGLGGDLDEGEIAVVVLDDQAIAEQCGAALPAEALLEPFDFAGFDVDAAEGLGAEAVGFVEAAEVAV